MQIALLGRQPGLSLAELERVFGDVSRFSQSTAVISSSKPVSIERLGGTQKAGAVVKELKSTNWSDAVKAIVDHYSQAWSDREGKITLGISAYDFDVSPREVQKVGLILKSKLKQRGVSLRLVPNQESTLSTATSHHNKLGLSDNKVELMVVRGRESIIVAESTGAQNITALAARDQGRPKRDAFVGMLPPKLAQIMINLATKGIVGDKPVLDPFCGTGVVLQEALLMGHTAYGTDLAEKMVQFSSVNLKWLVEKYHLPHSWKVDEGDATKMSWEKPLGSVVCETYLGQPFSAPPSPKKLEEVRGNCQHIISQFLKNIHSQLQPGTPLCIAVPAWRDSQGNFSRLPLVNQLGTFGYTPVEFKTAHPDELIYFRSDQVVAREILVMIRK